MVVVLKHKFRVFHGTGNLLSSGKTHYLQNFEISFFCIFFIFTPMSFLSANIEFVLLTDFELSMVAKPINSISVQKVVKNFKKYLAKLINSTRSC